MKSMAENPDATPRCFKKSFVQSLRKRHQIAARRPQFVTSVSFTNSFI